MLFKFLRLITIVLGLVVVALFAAPFFFSDPDFKKTLLMDLGFIAAALVALAIIGFIVSMYDTKLTEAKQSASGKTETPFSDNSLFDAKVRAMHERARQGKHMYPPEHVCQKKISARDMIMNALDPDDIIVDCYGSDSEGFSTRFYGSLDGGTSWNEISMPSSPRDRKTILKVALGIASIHQFANEARRKEREKNVGVTESTPPVQTGASVEERTLDL